MGFLDSLWGLYTAVAPAVFQAVEHMENDSVYSARRAVLGEVTVPATWSLQGHLVVH